MILFENKLCPEFNFLEDFNIPPFRLVHGNKR